MSVSGEHGIQLRQPIIHFLEHKILESMFYCTLGLGAIHKRRPQDFANF